MKRQLTFLILSLALISLVRAHAFLDHADPRVGSTVKSSPALVKIWFTEDLEPAFSRIRVVDAAKHKVDRHDLTVDSADKKLMTVSVLNLVPGRYEVQWEAVATDTHHTNGSFNFTVKP